MSEYRGYVSGEYKSTTTFNIGRTSNTGTGDVAPEVHDPPAGPLPDGSGFPIDSTVGYLSESTFSRINIKLAGTDNNVERVGAFYVKAVDSSGESVEITTIKLAEQATIKPADFIFTKTASIGDVITFEVNTNILDLRWSHNGGPTNKEWDNKSQITILNVRNADAGIYECFQDAHRGDGVHAIMRLIVRTCPRSKYGLTCNSACPTCFNGGICDANMGKCVCRPGFQGDNCEIACGSNQWGAKCSIICSKNGNCKGEYFCVPDPVGCSCMAGFNGEMCTEACAGTRYGSDCTRTCHCTEGCSQSKGCTDTDRCDNGYMGPQCQVPSTCPDGLYGEVCEFQCHCVSNAECDRGSGKCSNGQCADGWGGADCQQALPSLFSTPSTEVSGNNVSIRWHPWNFDIDYGTGPVDKYRVYFAQDGNEFSEGVDTEVTHHDFVDMKPETTFDFAVSAIRMINDSSWEGMKATVSNTTRCGVPISSPTITHINEVGALSLEIHWTVPSGDEWLKCSAIDSFILTYHNIELPEEKATKHIDGNATQTVIDDLILCLTYEFVIAVKNKDQYIGPNSASANASLNDLDKVTTLSAEPKSYHALNVSWGLPTIHCEITSYVVDVKLICLDQCRSQNVFVTSTNTSETYVIVEELEPFSTYDISVHAVSGDLNGGVDTTSEKTGETVPSGYPEILNVESSVHTLTITWDPPSCGTRHGYITHYEYVFGPMAGGDFINGTTNSECISFDNLSSNTSYDLKIRAATMAGPGQYKNVTGLKTTEISKDADNGWVFILVGIVGTFIILALVVMFACRYNKKNSQMQVDMQMDQSFQAQGDPQAVRNDQQRQADSLANMIWTEIRKISYQIMSSLRSIFRATAEPERRQLLGNNEIHSVARY